MAVRKSLEEEIVVPGAREDWMSRCGNALCASGFKDVKSDSLLFQISGKLRKFTTQGDILLTLIPAAEGHTGIKITSSANVDNIYALFKSPNKAVIQAFKDGLN